jgi:hypothetical protein
MTSTMRSKRPGSRNTGAMLSAWLVEPSTSACFTSSVRSTSSTVKSITGAAWSSGRRPITACTRERSTSRK